MWTAEFESQVSSKLIQTLIQTWNWSLTLAKKFFLSPP